MKTKRRIVSVVMLLTLALCGIVAYASYPSITIYSDSHQTKATMTYDVEWRMWPFNDGAESTITIDYNYSPNNRKTRSTIFAYNSSGNPVGSSVVDGYLTATAYVSAEAYEFDITGYIMNYNHTVWVASTGTVNVK